MNDCKVYTNFPKATTDVMNKELYLCAVSGTPSLHWSKDHKFDFKRNLAHGAQRKPSGYIFWTRAVVDYHKTAILTYFIFLALKAAMWGKTAN